MNPHDPVIAKILAFLRDIGIRVEIEAVKDSLLPGATVRSGRLVYDPMLPYPGDLLHEAGHIAVTDPALRTTLDEVSSEPGEEMAAIAWSYAAAVHIGIDPAIVFHGHGYQGGGDYLIAPYARGEGTGGPGVPLLQYFGMSAEPQRAEALGRPAYPAMTRWLR